MAKRSFMLAPDEQAVLDRLTVRLLQPNERARFDALLVEHHYLSGTDFVGEQLRYIAEVDGQWLALFVWTAPAYRVASASVRDGVSPQAIVFGPEYGNEDDQQNGSLICRRGCTGSISPDSLAPAA
jgi:hypothetical protein